MNQSYSWPCQSGIKQEFILALHNKANSNFDSCLLVLSSHSYSFHHHCLTAVFHVACRGVYHHVVRMYVFSMWSPNESNRWCASSFFESRSRGSASSSSSSWFIIINHIAKSESCPYMTNKRPEGRSILYLSIPLWSQILYSPRRKVQWWGHSIDVYRAKCSIRSVQGK